MKVYFYSENRTEDDFDGYLLEDRRLRKLDGIELSKLVHLAGEKECRRKLNDARVAAEGRCRIKVCLAFKMEFDQRASDGRDKILFGMTEDVWSADSLRNEIDNICSGSLEVVSAMGMTIASDKIIALRRELTAEYAAISQHRKRQCAEVSVAGAALAVIAGVTIYQLSK